MRNPIISPDSIVILKKFFVFDKIFILCEYDHNMVELYDELKNLKKETYKSNYRFIFLHYETEYYFHDLSDSVGVTLLNLHRILQSLDIPNYFCLILTQQQIINQLEYIKNLTSNECIIDSLTYFNYYAIELLNNDIDHKLEINENAICEKYLALNRVNRFHRHALISLLKQKNLLDHGIISYNAKPT